MSTCVLKKLIFCRCVLYCSVVIVIFFVEQVDSITFTTASGVVFKAGGDGGGEPSVLTIPADSTLCGFFGGTGGHLHNIGFVTFSSSSSPSIRSVTNTAKSNIYHALLDIIANLAIWKCGALNFIQNIADKERCSDIGLLVKLVSEVYLQNSRDVYSTCLNSIVAYVRNIAKDLSSKKTVHVKLSNAFLNRTIVAARGGLELLSFGPAGFKPSVHPVEGLCLESAVVQMVRATASAERRREVLAWLEVYSSFLQAAASISLS